MFMFTFMENRCSGAAYLVYKICKLHSSAFNRADKADKDVNIANREGHEHRQNHKIKKEESRTKLTKHQAGL